MHKNTHLITIQLKYQINFRNVLTQFNKGFTGKEIRIFNLPEKNRLILLINLVFNFEVRYFILAHKTLLCYFQTNK